MKKVAALILTTALLIVVSGCTGPVSTPLPTSPSPGDSNSTPSILPELLPLIATVENAFLLGNTDLIRGVVASEFTFYIEDALKETKTISNLYREQVAGFFRSMIASTVYTDFNYVGPELGASTNVRAVVHAMLLGRYYRDGFNRQETANVTFTFTKEAGKWKIERIDYLNYRSILIEE